MFKIMVNNEVVETVKTNEEAFEKCLGVLLKHTKGNQGMTEKLTRQLSETHKCFVLTDGTFIEFKEMPTDFIDLLYPTNPDSKTSSDGEMSLEQKYIKAEASIRKTLRLDPTDANANINLSLLLWEQGQFKKAEAALQKAIHIELNEPNLFDNLGLLFLEQGKTLEAKAAFNQALQVDPNFKDAQKHLRKLHRQKKKT